MADSLKINPAILPEEGLTLSFSEDATWFEACFSGGRLPDFSLIRADVTCLITRLGETVYIRGTLSETIRQDCSRCLEPTTLSVDGDFFYTLMPEKAELEEERELTAEELETSFYSGDFIDLAPLLCEQIVLQAPMKALCSEDCKGLCPHCGANLNVTACSCQSDSVDPRLAVLKNFKVKK